MDMEKDMDIERVYIPYLINHRKITQDGGIKKIKQKICQTFAKLDKNGAMYLGIVKKIDIVVKKNATTNTNTNTNINKISAFITFIPACSKGAMYRIQEIKKENGLKLPYSKDEKYWIILQQRKQHRKQQHTIKCSNCNQTQKKITNTNANVNANKDIADLFEELSCNDSGHSRKRMRV